MDWVLAMDTMISDTSSAILGVASVAMALLGIEVTLSMIKGGFFRGVMEDDGEQHSQPQDWCHGPLPCLDEGCNLSSIGPDATCNEAADEAHDHGTQECPQVMERQC